MGLAILTVKKFTLAAPLQTSSAVVLVTHFAGFRAAVAESLGTSLASVRTLAAQVGFASVTRLAILLAHGTSAVLARQAVPFRERDVGTIGVVGIKDLPHDDEEVEQPSLIQGSFDRHSSLALAERVALNVRMRCLKASARRIRIQRFHAVGQGIAELTALQHNRERPEVEIVKDDLPSRDGKFIVAMIVLHVCKFSSQCHKITIQVAKCDARRRVHGQTPFPLHDCQLIQQGLLCVDQLSMQAFRRIMPAACVCLADPPRQLLAFEPGGSWQLHDWFVA